MLIFKNTTILDTCSDGLLFTENKKEGIKILKRLGFKKKTIEAFIENIIRCYEDDEEQMVKEIMMGKVPKRLLN